MKRIVALSLTVIMLISILPLSAYANDTNATGGGENTFDIGGGSTIFSDYQTGYRFTFVDSTGNVVSNTVDIVFNMNNNTGSKFNIPSNMTVMTGNKFERYNEKNINGIKQYNVSEILSDLREISTDTDKIPYPIAFCASGKNKGTFLGNGENFKYWLVAEGDGLYIGPSGSYSNTPSWYTPIPSSRQKGSSVITSSEESINSAAQNRTYLKMVESDTKSNTPTATKPVSASDNPKPQTSGWDKTKQNVKNGAATIWKAITGVFSVSIIPSYGASTATQDVEAQYKGNMKNFIDLKESDGGYIFNLDKGKAADYIKPSNIAAYNNYYLMVEPIMWVYANNGGCYYGTPTNFAQLEKYKGITTNARNTMYVTAPYSLCLLNSFANMSAPSAANMVNKVRVSVDDLASASNGYAVQLYMVSGSTDDEEGTPTPEPGKPIVTQTFDNPYYPNPHPAPDTSKIPINCAEDTRDTPIIKTYIVIDENGEEQHVETLTRENNPFIVNIVNEGEYRVENFFIASNYYKTSSGTTWSEILGNTDKIGEFEHVYENTNKSTKGEIIDRVDLGLDAKALYVKLVTYKKAETSTNAISESQITKTVSTADELEGDNWGTYAFNAAIEAAQTGHAWDVHVGCKCKFNCGHCLDYGAFCNAMRRANADNQVSATFSGLHTKATLETFNKSGASTLFYPKVVSGANAVPNLTYSYTIDDNSQKWTKNQDYTSDDGVAYFTTLWRGTVDTLTLANYKQWAMKNTVYSAVNSIYTSGIAPATARANQKKYLENLSLRLGLSQYDNIAISQCFGGPSHHAITSDTKTATMSITSDTVDSNIALDFNTVMKILVYGGEVKNASGEAIPKFSGYLMSFNGASSDNTSLLSKQYTANPISFYPYIRMSFMITADGYDSNLYSEEMFTALNSSDSKYSSYLRDRTVYILSDKQSAIIPNNSVEVGWYNEKQSNNGFGLQLNSTQWSVHARATGDDYAWQGVNKVLPGGALYSLETKNSETIVKTVTYSTLIDDVSRNWIYVSTPTDYTSDSIVTNNNNYITQIRDTLENLRIVQWVNKNYTLDYAWSNTSSAVKVSDGNESLTNLGLNTKSSTDAKYRLVSGTGNNSATEGDLDIINEGYNTTVFKVFTDTEGNVYVARAYNQVAKAALTTAELNNLVTVLKSTCGTNVSVGSQTGITADIIKIGSKNDGLDSILTKLSQDPSKNYLYQLDAKTGIITNVVNSITRNKGNDNKAAWVTDGKWYNEAFDGMYVVQQIMTYKMGISIPNKRIAVLDPNLCPPKASTKEVCTNAYISQFCLDSKSTSQYANGKANGFIGTFDGMDVSIPDVEYMYISKKFSIPNMNVQDLS